MEAHDNIVLVGTKLDDVKNRMVSKEEAEAICDQFNCLAYFETSSSTGENVDEAFFAVSSHAFQKTLLQSDKSVDNTSTSGGYLT